MSDPHDVDVEDHIKTMMANTGRSKRNAARLDLVEPRQGDLRERMGVVERVIKAVETLPERVAELAGAAKAVADLPERFTAMEIERTGSARARTIILSVLAVALVAVNVGVAIWATRGAG